MTWFTDIFTAHSALQAVVVLSLIAAGTTWHILSYRTLEKDAPAE